MTPDFPDLVRHLAHGTDKVPSVTAFCTDSACAQMPDDGTPYICIVAAGTLRLHTPSGMLDYAAGQYSLSAIDTPSSGEVLAFSERGDFAALSVAFGADEAVSVLIEADGDLVERIVRGELGAAVMADADSLVIDTAARLVRLSGRADFLPFMARQLRREIIFYALCGSCGRQFVQAVTAQGDAGGIFEANRWIKEHYKRAFSVNELAAMADMSVSRFHERFKGAVGMGLLQCQKRLRLTEARRLMLSEARSVTDAAFEVGYESLSQFVRDYKKMYGAPPKEDMRRLKELAARAR